MIVFKKTRRKCGSFFLPSEDCNGSFVADSSCNFCHARAVKSARSTTRESQVVLKRSSAALKCCVFVAKRIGAMMQSRTSTISIARGLIKRTIEDCCDGPMAKDQRVLADQYNVTSANRGFRTKDNSTATHEQTKKGLSYFQPKRIVEEDGIQTVPSNIQQAIL